MDSKKLINCFEMKKTDSSLITYQKNYFVYQFVDNFSELLLCKINILDFFDMGDFFQIFVIPRSTKILMESKF